MKTKLLLLLLTASVGANIAFLVTTMVTRRDQPAPTMERLGLDAGQRGRLQMARETFVAERARVHARIGELRRSLAVEISGPRPDSSRTTRLVAQIAEIQAEMRPRFVAYLLEMHGLLRPDQRAHLAEILRRGGPGMAACPAAALEPISDPKVTDR
jgi:Spy/CpxP family protein refolding chaperone